MSYVDQTLAGLEVGGWLVVAILVIGTLATVLGRNAGDRGDR